MSKTFVVADTHFYDSSILELESRPFNSKFEMTEKMVEKWNNVVGKEDTVFHLGDVLADSVTLKIAKDVISSLNGVKQLIKGNHDQRFDNLKWLDIGFSSVSDYTVIYKNCLFLSHKPPEYFNMNNPYFYIYGHVHSTPMYSTYTSNTACVCVERFNYEPVEIEKVIQEAHLYDEFGFKILNTNELELLK